MSLEVVEPAEKVNTKAFDIFELLPGKMLDVQINHPVQVRLKVPLIGYELGKSAVAPWE